MMEWTNLIFAMPLLCGVIFVIAGGIVYAFPPKKINDFYGYRTPGSKLSQERWDFSQKYASLKMIESGILLLFSSLLGIFFPFSDNAELTISLFLLILSAVYMFLRTERTMDKKFPKP